MIGTEHSHHWKIDELGQAVCYCGEGKTFALSLPEFGWNSYLDTLEKREERNRRIKEAVLKSWDGKKQGFVEEMMD